jgi:hypothetical protein
MSSPVPNMVIGSVYNFKHQTDYMKYLGRLGVWHQFKKIGDRRPVWAELSTSDLAMIELSI